jgi:hypothetical protein
MSTPMPLPTVVSPAASRRGVVWPLWAREPLLHFVVLGGLLFGADQLIAGRAADPLHIVVGAEVDDQARQLFKASRGREPSAEEMNALRRVWLDNEVLYREGLALQVDRGDTAIRERVIFKALSVVDANTKLPAFDDKVLRAWFESHRTKYDEPARFDFQEAVLTGDTTEAAVRTFADTLNAGTPGDAKAGLRVFKGRPHANLVASYGPEFAKALEQAPLGEWRAQATREGWRVMRLEAISPPKPAVFDALRGVVLQDWTDAILSEQRSAAVQALAKKYKVSYETVKP